MQEPQESSLEMRRAALSSYVGKGSCQQAPYPLIRCAPPTGVH
ncbi:hypothetical protein LMG24238_07632 [Paraburkholderia sediminicola]|uniref:Uncharacterized protein n=1 Tax=Paraburkholderia sediminicola TaxID=458836 RepID=A0A6J5CWI1_9BURK|nr:hypothetical protein LMG24238_07632 [Paraburkholderia sediminicola]